MQVRVPYTLADRQRFEARSRHGSQSSERVLAVPAPHGNTQAVIDDIRELQDLKYRYLHALDMKRWDDFADTLCEDVIADYGSHAGDRELTFQGRSAVVDYMRNAMGTFLTSTHSCTHPQIEVEGDDATGSWLLQDVVLIPAKKLEIRGAAYYRDRYRRENGVWRIASTGYERIYETLTSYADQPGYQVLANIWSD